MAEFPERPLTFHSVAQEKDGAAQMAILLPTSHDRGRKHPLLIFLNGGDEFGQPVVLPRGPSHVRLTLTGGATLGGFSMIATEKG